MITSSVQHAAQSASTPSTCFVHTQSHIDILLEQSPVYKHFLGGPNKILLVSASPSRVVCQFVVQAHQLNSKNSLHGSTIATLVDFIGGVVIAASYFGSGRHNTGVSADMHISFVGGAKLGETVSVEGCTERVGGSLAFTTVLIRRVPADAGKMEEDESKLVVARASHTKFVRESSGSSKAATNTGP